MMQGFSSLVPKSQGITRNRTQENDEDPLYTSVEHKNIVCTHVFVCICDRGMGVKNMKDKKKSFHFYYLKIEIIGCLIISVVLVHMHKGITGHKLYLVQQSSSPICIERNMGCWDQI